VRREGDRFVLNGSKTFSTGAQVADNVMIAFPFEEKILIAMVPRDRPGLRPNDDWNNIGMRRTASGSVIFDKVVVEMGELLGDPFGSGPHPVRPTLFIPLAQST
jgi:alkylation response protein AidB-like acyl-CoA dehydrogenase